MAPGVAMYCPHCGLSFSSLPPPTPMPAVTRPARGNLLMLIWILLGLIGFAAWMFLRMAPEDEATVEPLPQPIHRHYHYP